ncbi:MAG: CvpA family protein [Desulfuromonadaceae bacterium]|nr:CvpA family protein [Desulfuromonadaceae bacterium]MDD5107348.1 CvpA family protein [Desulfuromonadaceae bacterium]
MNLIDIITLSVLCFFAMKGLVRGLVCEASSLAGLLAGGWLAYRFHPLLAVPIQSALHLPAHLSSFLAFIIILLTTGICAHIIGNVITAAVRLVMLGSLNRLGGLLIGFSEGALLLCMVFSIASSGYMPESVRNRVYASKSATLLAQTGDSFLSEWRNSTGQKK